MLPKQDEKYFFISWLQSPIALLDGFKVLASIREHLTRLAVGEQDGFTLILFSLEKEIVRSARDNIFTLALQTVNRSQLLMK